MAVINIKTEDGSLGFYIQPDKDDVFVLNKQTKKWGIVEDLTSLALSDIIYVENKVNHERYLDQDGNLTFQITGYMWTKHKRSLDVTVTPCSTTN